MLKSLFWTKSESTFNITNGGALSLPSHLLDESERLSSERNSTTKKMKKKKKRTIGSKSPFPKRSPLITPFESSFFKTSNTDNYRLKAKFVPIWTHNPKIFNFKTKYAHMTLTLKKDQVL